MWNVTTGAFDEITDVAVICAERFVESGVMVNDCIMHIKVPLTSSDINLFQMTYNTTVDQTVKASTSGVYSI